MKDWKQHIQHWFTWLLYYLFKNFHSSIQAISLTNTYYIYVFQSTYFLWFLTKVIPTYSLLLPCLKYFLTPLWSVYSSLQKFNSPCHQTTKQIKEINYKVVCQLLRMQHKIISLRFVYHNYFFYQSSQPMSLQVYLPTILLHNTPNVVMVHLE